jgi:hypothetical protein
MARHTANCLNRAESRTISIQNDNADKFTILTKFSHFRWTERRARPDEPSLTQLFFGQAYQSVVESM